MNSNSILFVLAMFALVGCGESRDQQTSRNREEIASLTATTQELIKLVNTQTQFIQNLNQRVNELESNQVVYEEEEEEEDCPPVVVTPPKKAPPAAKKAPEKASSVLQSKFKADKLNIVIFKEDWCPHCRRYIAAVRSWDDPYLNFIVIDTSKEPEMAKLKRKNGIPETQIYSGAGEFLAIESGFSTQEDFQKWFNKYKPKRTQS